MLLAELIGVFIITLSVVYIYYKYVLLNYWRKKGVFYVEPTVPAGNLTPYVTGKVSVGELFRDAYMKYKDHRVFGMYAFFKPNLVIADLDLIRTVLAKEFGSFHDRGMFCNEKIDPLSGHLFLLPGKKWRNLRVKLTPTFTSGKIKQMFMILKECGEEFAKNLENKAQMRDCIEIKDIFASVSAQDYSEIMISYLNLATVNKLTMLEAAAQAYVFFLAGFETSSTTATYCLYELAQHQGIQDKIRQEIDEMLKQHGGLTYNAVNEMIYLHKVVNETMRKYPPVPVLNRVCTKELDLPTTNIHVTEGTLITIPVFGLHRDPSIYPHPDKFDPERFNADKIAARHPYAYLPFGEGPRVCIGTRFGYMQTKIGLVSLLSKYKFKLHPRTPVPLTFDEAPIVLTVKGGVHLIIEPR
ncbi:probable cytochrome P450 6a20 [Formica exsecta]|uniref:probable cytochrome P450 6a20 n=1 Tax=Formica exsecta TaxID=72781 RepID=UPI001143C38E|nr:probable cytochrome P450 6a20 [Formica exsecta]